jgi:hypothetical protein
LRFGLALTFSSALSIAAPSHPTKAATVPARNSGVPSSATTLRGDVVRLRTGATVRGVIDEKFPGEYVTITTPSGIARRFEWKDVAYAGPTPAEVNITPSDVNPDSPTAGPRSRKSMPSTGTNPGQRTLRPNGDSMTARTRSPFELASEALGENPTELDAEDTSIAEATRVANGSSQGGNAARGRASPLRGEVASGTAPAKGNGAAWTTSLVIGSIGIAVLGVAVVSGIEWSNREGQLAALCGKDGRCNDGRPHELSIEEESQAITLNRARKTYRTLALGTAGTGAAALITATVLLLTSRVDHDTARSAQLLVPLAAGADRAGVSIRLSF